MKPGIALNGSGAAVALLLAMIVRRGEITLDEASMKWPENKEELAAIAAIKSAIALMKCNGRVFRT